MQTVTITPAAASAVLWFFKDDVGRDPGHFTATLLEAFAHADLDNRARLVEAFPELGHAFLLAKSARDGIEQLRQAVTS